MKTLNIELDVKPMENNFLRKGSNITCIGVSRKKLDCSKNDGPKGYFVKWKFKKDSQVPPELKLFAEFEVESTELNSGDELIFLRGTKPGYGKLGSMDLEELCELPPKDVPTLELLNLLFED